MTFPTKFQDLLNLTIEKKQTTDRKKKVQRALLCSIKLNETQIFRTSDSYGGGRSRGRSRAVHAHTWGTLKTGQGTRLEIK